jgi:glutathione-specific gamma-glutamylcyclotransferase
VAIPGHEQFAGDLEQEAVLACVRQGQGAAGTCADYVRNTVAHLQEIGIAEPGLEVLVERLGA